MKNRKVVSGVAASVLALSYFSRLFAISTVLIVNIAPWLTASAATNEWYPGGSGFSGWPTNWVAIPSLNDPKELAASNARLDFVGDTLNPGAYWSSDSNYIFIRMRVAVSNVTSSTFRDSHWIYIDRVDYTNGAAAPNMPDYALAWDTKNIDTAKHGLELQTGTNLTAATDWGQMQLDDIDGVINGKIAPPDFNLLGDGYIRTIDMSPTTNFGYTTYIDFAVKWSFISANTALASNQQWRIQFGSRNDATDHNFPQDDIAGGFSKDSVVASSYSSVFGSVTLSSAIDLSLYATADGVMIELWTVNEAGYGDIVIYAWINDEWVEVGRVPTGRIVGEGSNRYFVGSYGGLAVDGSYFIKIVEEGGHIHYSGQPVAVKSTRLETVRLDMETLTMSFNTEYGQSYVIKVSTDLVNWVNEYVSHPTATGPSEYVNTPFIAGPGTQTQILVPVNGRAHSFFKVVMVEE